MRLEEEKTDKFMKAVNLFIKIVFLLANIKMKQAKKNTHQILTS